MTTPQPGKETHKALKDIIPNVLTALSAPPTKASPNNTIYERFKRRARFNPHNNQLQEMFEAAAKFAASLNFTAPYWLTICGRSGIGKTHLAKAINRQFMEQNRFELKFNKEKNKIEGNTSAFIDWRKFCADIRAGDHECIEWLCDEWFVTLDDVGSERDPTGFIASSLDRILNSRQRKWTLITTNLLLSEVAQIDPRMSSRMLRNSGVVIECDATDYSLCF